MLIADFAQRARSFFPHWGQGIPQQCVGQRVNGRASFQPSKRAGGFGSDFLTAILQRADQGTDGLGVGRCPQDPNGPIALAVGLGALQHIEQGRDRVGQECFERIGDGLASCRIVPPQRLDQGFDRAGITDLSQRQAGNALDLLVFALVLEHFDEWKHGRRMPDASQPLCRSCALGPRNGVSQGFDARLDQAQILVDLDQLLAHGDDHASVPVLNQGIMHAAPDLPDYSLDLLQQFLPLLHAAPGLYRIEVGLLESENDNREVFALMTQFEFGVHGLS